VNEVDHAHPAGWYLASVASFMIPAGIQMVLLPYLLAIELNQPAARFGVTQMLGQLPMLLLLLFGGWLADRVDPRKILIRLHVVAILMPLSLAFVLWRNQLNETFLVLYAVAWGLVSAFAMPARDGLLKRVAGDKVQRMVTLAIGMQFGTQMVGQGLGGRAAHWGPISILLVQCLALAAGIFAAGKLPPATAKATLETAGPIRETLLREFGGGLTLIFSDASMRTTFLMTLGMGVFFGGVFAVLMPLAIRDLYAGGAQDIAIGFIVFGVGTLISITALTRRGGLMYPGRALAMALLLGCCTLLPIALAPPKWAFYLCIFFWGICGGVAMSMSRTILQEHAPPTHQSRTMAVLSLSTAGGGPAGALIMGFAVSALSVRWAILVPILGVAVTTASALAAHSIWRLRSHSH
jgi:MFS family permease